MIWRRSGSQVIGCQLAAEKKASAAVLVAAKEAAAVARVAPTPAPEAVACEVCADLLNAVAALNTGAALAVACLSSVACGVVAVAVAGGVLGVAVVAAVDDGAAGAPVAATVVL